LNICATCGEDFGSVSAFDAHRVGKILQTWPAEYSDRVKAGLALHPQTEEWQPAYGRRCLDSDEMLESGRFELNGWGAWSLTRDLSRAREVLARAS
jgi:hypothetical protein